MTEKSARRLIGFVDFSVRHMGKTLLVFFGLLSLSIVSRWVLGVFFKNGETYAGIFSCFVCLPYISFMMWHGLYASDLYLERKISRGEVVEVRLMRSRGFNKSPKKLACFHDNFPQVSGKKECWPARPISVETIDIDRLETGEHPEDYDGDDCCGR